MKGTDWTSTRKMRSIVSRRFSHAAKQPGSNPSFDAILANTPLMSLPIELLQQINDFLPLSSQACFALSCHRLHAIIGTRSWKELNTQDQSKRLEKINFLRLLRRDLSDSSHWLCHRCIKFHPKDSLGLPTRAGVHEKGKIADAHSWYEHEWNDTYYGFPFCTSMYTLAHEFMHSVLKRRPIKTPRGTSLDAASTFYWHGHGGHGVGMEYKLFPRVAGTKFLLFASHRFHHPGPDYLSKLHFDICPHHGLAPDYARGDGSLMDRLAGGGLTRYTSLANVCLLCRLEFEVSFKALAFGMGAMTIDVWQDLGSAKVAPYSNFPRFLRYGRRLKGREETAAGDVGSFQLGSIRMEWENAPVDKVALPEWIETTRGPFGGKHVDDGGWPVWVSYGCGSEVWLLTSLARV